MNRIPLPPSNCWPPLGRSAPVTRVQAQRVIAAYNRWAHDFNTLHRGKHLSAAPKDEAGQSFEKVVVGSVEFTDSASLVFDSRGVLLDTRITLINDDEESITLTLGVVTLAASPDQTLVRRPPIGLRRLACRAGRRKTASNLGHDLPPLPLRSRGSRLVRRTGRVPFPGIQDRPFTWMNERRSSDARRGERHEPER